MRRDELKIGQRVTLFCNARNGYVTGLPSALSPLGVASAEAMPSFEQAVFIIMSPEGDAKEPRHVGEPVKFGSVLRLYHSWQHKCITHNSNLVSNIDRSNQRVTLEDLQIDSKQQRSMWNRWRIMPRYKVRAEGECVTDGDHVVFQISSGESSFLQVSTRRDESIDMCYEMNAGGLSEGFSLRLYDEEVYVPKNLRGYVVESPELRCGDCLMFQHKEERSNLVTRKDLSYFEPLSSGSSSGGGGAMSGSMSGSGAGGMHVGLAGGGDTLRFSMCVIENENPFKGGVVRSGASHGYRLKDLRSGQYLMVTSINHNGLEHPDGRRKNINEFDDGAEGMLALTVGSDRTSDASVFMFHDTIDEQGRSLVQCSKVYIQCRAYGGVWLVAGEAMKGTVETRMTRRFRRCVRFLPHKSPGDGIEVHRIPAEDHQQLNMILLPLPPIISFVMNTSAFRASAPPSSGPLSSEPSSPMASEWAKIPQVHENLLQLNHFCSASKNGTRAQRLLHEQGVTGLCIAVCKHIFDTCRFTEDQKLVDSPQLASSIAFGNLGGESVAMTNFMSINIDRLLSNEFIPGSDIRYQDAYECAKQAFRLIAVIVKNQSEHALTIAKDMLFLIDCSCFCDEAAAALMACLDRNMILADTPNELDFVNAICDKLLTDQGSDNLFNILALLASCGSVGLPAAQLRICSLLLRDRKVATEIFLPISLISGVVHFTVPAFMYEESSNGSNPNLMLPSASMASAVFRRGTTVLQPPSPTTPRLPAARQVSLPSLMATVGHRPKFAQFIKLLTGQIDLFAALARGRNQHASASLIHVIAMEALNPCIQDPSLPPSLRASLLRLCAAWAVDCEGSPNVLDACTALCYVVEEHAPIAIEYDLPPSLRPVKDYALDCMLKVRDFVPMTPLAIDDLVLLHAAMDTVAALFIRGAFRLREYRALLAILARILVQWTNEEQTHDDPTERSQTSLALLKERVYDIRQQALTILDTMVTFLVSRDALDVIHRFANGVKIGRLPQIADLNPMQRLDDTTTQVHTGRSYSIADVERMGNDVIPIPSGDMGDDPVSVLPTLLRSVLYTSSAFEKPLALNAVRIFWRLTNYPRDLEAACSTIQLLATGRSGQYFKQAKVHCDILSRLSTTVLSIDQIPRCFDAIEALDHLLSSPFGGTLHEKILMMKNLHLAQSVLSLLNGIPVPLEEEFTPLVSSSLALLTVLVQDDALATIVTTDIEKIVHLILYDEDAISLLKTLYFNRPFAATIDETVIREVINGLAHDDLALLCIRFLTGVIASKDEVGRYHNNVQDMVWKCIQGNAQATTLFRFRDRWCGKGKRKRDELLSHNNDFFNPTGVYQLHLECVNLVYLILKKNDITRHTEVRHALFGPNATDEILEVISNPRVPMMMRSKYVQLLTVLILRDKSYRASFYAHRGFIHFLHISAEDVSNFRKRIGDAGFDAASCMGPVSSLTGTSEPSTDGDSGIFTAQRLPNNASQVEVYADYNSVATYSNHLLNDLSMALKDIFDSAGELPETILSPVVFEKTMRGMNLLIDQLSAFVRFVFVLNDYKAWPDIMRMDKGRRRLKTAMIAAQRQHLCGTTQWATDFATLIQRIAVNADVEGNDIEAAGRREELASSNALATLQGNLSYRWRDYYEAISSLESSAPENLYASAAGFVLRCGYLGSKFLCNAVRLAAGLAESNTIEVMKFTLQVLQVREGHAYDECAGWSFPRFEDDDSETDHLAIQPLTLQMSLEERQNVVASWSLRDERILPSMILLLSSPNDEVFEATIRCVIGLLEGGNRIVQEDIFHWLASRADEVLFFVLRNRLLGFLEHVRQHQRLVALSLSRAAAAGGMTDPASIRIGERQHFKQASERASLILRFMHLLCEGHNMDLQNYLRTQPDNQLSVNVIDPMLSLLSLMVVNVDESSFDTLLQLLFTVAEALQGPCPGNQEVMVALGIGESLAALLALRTTALSHDQLQQLYFLSAIVLRSLLEGRTSPVFVSLLLKSASLMSLIEAMDRSYESYEEGSLGEDVKRLLLGQPRRPPEYGDELTVGTELLIFLRACLDIQDRGKRVGGGGGSVGVSSQLDFTDKFGATIRSALRQSKHWKQINQLIGAIEIARGEGVEKVYFRIPAVSRENLKEDSKEQLIKQVARDSDNARISDFFDRCNKLIAELEYYESLRRTPGLALIQAHVPKLQLAAFVLAIGLNLYMIISLSAQVVLSMDWLTSTEILVMQVLGGIQMGMQVLLFVYFFFGPMKVRLDDTWGRWQDELNSEAIRESRSQLSVAPPKLNFHRVQELPWVFYLTRSLWTLMAYHMFWMRVLFLLAGVAGFFWTPEWYSVQLLQVVQFSPQLHIVVLSVTKHGSALLLTFVMLLIVVYILSAISFQYYAQYYPDITENFSCHTVFQCFLINLSDGLRLNGGIGDALKTTNYHTSLISRSLYDFVFFLLCQLMFLKLVFGIIVDTFAELREGREAIKEDQEKKCFICGITSNEFDRVDPGGFEHHIKAEHNMWNYVFFMHFLRMKPKEELNGAEDYCLAMIQENNVAFFPIGKATTLEKRTKKEQEEARNLITR